MRLFVAVAVPAHVADELDEAVAPLRESWPGLRWTRRDAWHLTLAFLGEVSEPVSSRLVPRLERAAARYPRLLLSLGERGPFPAPPGPACCGPGCGASRVLCPPWPRPWRPGRDGQAHLRPRRAAATSRT